MAAADNQCLDKTCVDVFTQDNQLIITAAKNGVKPTAAPSKKATTKASTKPAAKKITITCVKGKTTQKVTAVKPVCPKGYTKK